MTQTKFFDDLIAVSASIDSSGDISPHNFRWQGKQYTITGVGRQWADKSGRHVLVEANGDRFEIELSRDDLLWRLKQAWQQELLA